MLVILISAFVGCASAAKHSKQLHSDADRKMTVGVVQKEIRKDTTQAEVATALGSPNMVSRDKDGMETWIYDKIATEVSYSESEVSGDITGLLLGGVGSGLGGVLGDVGGSKSAGAVAQTQKTLTVVIKFKDNLVKDFSYHSSKF